MQTDAARVADAMPQSASGAVRWPCASTDSHAGRSDVGGNLPTQLQLNQPAGRVSKHYQRRKIVFRLFATLGTAALLAGCAVAPWPDYAAGNYGYPYGYGYPYDGYGYYPDYYYGPAFGSIGFWGGWGGGYYRRGGYGRGGYGRGGYGRGGGFRGGGHGGQWTASGGFRGGGMHSR